MEIPTKVVRYFIGMTRSDDAPNSKFTAPQNDTERVREGTTTDQVRHDLSAATRRQIPICLRAYDEKRVCRNRKFFLCLRIVYRKLVEWKWKQALLPPGREYNLSSTSFYQE